MVKINLLDSKRKELIIRRTRAKQWVVGSGILSSVIVLATLLVTGYVANLSRNINKLEQEAKSLTSQIESFADTTASLSVVTDKLTSSRKILDTRKIARIKISLFEELYQTNLVTLRNVGLGGASNPYVFELQGSSINLGQFYNFNAYLQEISPQRQIETINLDSLNRTNQGQYNYSYTITFSESKARAL